MSVSRVQPVSVSIPGVVPCPDSELSLSTRADKRLVRVYPGVPAVPVHRTGCPTVVQASDLAMSRKDKREMSMSQSTVSLSKPAVSRRRYPLWVSLSYLVSLVLFAGTAVSIGVVH